MVNLITWYFCVFISCLFMSVISAWIEAKQDYESHDENWLLGFTDKHIQYGFIHCLWYLICCIFTIVYLKYYELPRNLIMWIFPILGCTRGIHIWLHDGLYCEFKNYLLGVNSYIHGFTTDIYSLSNEHDKEISNTYNYRKRLAIIGLISFIIIELLIEIMY